MRSPVAVLLAFVLAIAACGRSAESGTDATAGASCCAADASGAPATSAPAPAGSIYALESRWRDQSGRELRLAELAGRPRVLAMIFTHCEYACPRILAELRELESALAGPPSEGPGFVLVSFDSARDDPAALAAYARAQSLDLGRWTLLHGEADAVRELSVVLDLPFRADPDGGFSHASAISVLDGAGRLIHQKRGLGGDLTDCRGAMRSTH